MKMPENDPLMLAIVKLVNPETANTPIDAEVVTSLLRLVHHSRNFRSALFLSGVFTYAKNQGAYDGVNPIRDAMIPEKAAKPLETYAASPDEVLAMMEALDKAGEPKASTAVALIVLCWLAPWRSAWRVLGRLRRSADAGSAIRVARVRERT